MTGVRRPLSRGDVVLLAVPFTNLSQAKPRPALIVGRPSGDDIVVAFVTTRLESIDPEAEHLLEPSDSEFAGTGLRSASRIRANEIATLHRDLARRRLGRIGPRTAAVVARSLRHVLELD